MTDNRYVIRYENNIPIIDLTKISFDICNLLSARTCRLISNKSLIERIDALFPKCLSNEAKQEILNIGIDLYERMNNIHK